MYREPYLVNSHRPRRGHKLRWILLAALTLIAGFIAYKVFWPTPVERAVSQLQFDSSVTEGEKQTITQAVKAQAKTFDGSLTVGVKTVFKSDSPSLILAAYVPVTHLYAPRQAVTKPELGKLPLSAPPSVDAPTRAAIAKLIGIETTDIAEPDVPLDKLTEKDIALMPADGITAKVKLLKLNSAYYLDSFKAGAIFRQAEFSGNDAAKLSDLKLNTLTTKSGVLKVNMTGVTALTRTMLQKLNAGVAPTYFSQKIGDFLADADITHISNEVSFKSGCTYSHTVFCSDPRFIKTLKDSGVDLVELTGNHNNDTGNQDNTDTIKLYHKLGWQTFGGGLNAKEAAKFYVANKKGSKVAFLGYNYPDSPNGGAIARATTAGANSFDFDKIKTDITAAKQQADFVIVDVQFWECYAYPDGYVEFPECYRPITNQETVFQKIVDLGADMVIGTQAHQPQTYEIYKGKPIYYGLGNMYFEQTQQPGTERGVILTHYFMKGKLLQTKLSPTVYDTALQTRLMTNQEAVTLLENLKAARD